MTDGGSMQGELEACEQAEIEVVSLRGRLESARAALADEVGARLETQRAAALCS